MKFIVEGAVESTGKIWGSLMWSSMNKITEYGHIIFRKICMKRREMESGKINYLFAG